MSFATPLRSLVVAAFALLIACGEKENQKPTQEPVAAPAGKTEAASPAAAKTFTLSLADYRKETDADLQGAMAKYKDAVLEISGASAGVKLEKQDGKLVPAVMLGASPPSDDVDSIACLTRSATPWSEVGPAGDLTIRGRIADPYSGDTLKDCEIVSFKGDPYRIVKAAEVAAEYKADAKAAREKYPDGDAVVSGQVDEHVKEEGGDEFAPQNLVLKGADDVTVWVAIRSLYNSEFENVKVGDEVVVLGELRVSVYDKKTPISVTGARRLNP